VPKAKERTMDANQANRPTALITGASGGIGLEFARLAAAAGHDLVLVARGGARLAEVEQELEGRHGVAVRTVVADLAEPGAASEVAATVEGRLPDVLINNAGVGGSGRFAVQRPLGNDLAMIRLNVLSLVELTGLLLPAMVARGSGGILNVASTAGFLPGPGQAVYYASKAFVKSFSEALTEECRGTGVRVTALCPGPVDTGFAQASGLSESMLMKTPGKVPAAEVARVGWEALAAGRAVVVPGLMMRVAMQSLRIAPRRLAAGLAGRANR
jgi:short-subunit dehydrogenase